MNIKKIFGKLLKVEKMKIFWRFYPEKIIEKFENEEYFNQILLNKILLKKILELENKYDNWNSR